VRSERFFILFFNALHSINRFLRTESVSGMFLVTDSQLRRAIVEKYTEMQPVIFP